MKRTTAWFSIFVFLLFSVLLQGCARRYKPLVQKDLTSVAPVRVAHYEELKYEVFYTGWRWVSGGLMCTTLLGGIISLIVIASSERGVQKEIVSAGVPKFNELLVKKFAQHVSKDLSHWLHMIVEERPVDSDFIDAFFKNKSGGLLLFDCDFLMLSAGQGLMCRCRAVLRDSEGKELWLKVFEYSAKEFGRHRSIKEYKADNFKLLREEVEFAADAVAANFINSLLKGTGTAGK